ncbi:MAG TPA: FHA domain-containing protein, partial [Egibacteraceae bacterium]|nr:FHA domain-containing protein [Egibacteraceae bacterium]
RAVEPDAPAPAPVPRSDEAARTSVLPRNELGSSAAILVGGEGGRRIGLNGTATVGRLPECDVTLDDPSVSRRHARIQRRAGTWTIEDLGSTNGLKVNGERVQQADLADGDRLQLGSVQLLFSMGD